MKSSDASKFRQRVELFSNIAVIVVSILISAALVDRYVISSSPKPPNQENPLKNGSRISVPDISWGESDKTLILAVSKTCRFCEESIPFYRKLTEFRSRK